MTNMYADDGLNSPFKGQVTFISGSFFPTCPSCWHEPEDNEREFATFQPNRPDPAKDDFVGDSVNL